jgi:predicted amidohydrolase YtcJ
MAWGEIPNGCEFTARFSPDANNNSAQADFDREPLLKGRPIVLRRVDGHAIWVSPRVLELSGELPDEIEGGTIVRGEDGNATGTLT